MVGRSNPPSSFVMDTPLSKLARARVFIDPGQYLAIFLFRVDVRRASLPLALWAGVDEGNKLTALSCRCIKGVFEDDGSKAYGPFTYLTPQPWSDDILTQEPVGYIRTVRSQTWPMCTPQPQIYHLSNNKRDPTDVEAADLSFGIGKQSLKEKNPLFPLPQFVRHTNSHLFCGLFIVVQPYMEGHAVFYDPGCPLWTTLAGALGIKSRSAQADYLEKRIMIVATPGPSIHVETEGGVYNVQLPFRFRYLPGVRS